MKINCKLTNSTEYNQFCCSENGIYTLKISKNFKYWYYDLCDLIDFYNGSNIQIDLDVEQPDLALARKLYGNHKYNECVLRDYETKANIGFKCFNSYFGRYTNSFRHIEYYI